MKSTTHQMLSLMLFLSGLMVMIDAKGNSVGAVVGVSLMPSSLNVMLGLSLMLISYILFLTSEGGLERIVKEKKKPRNFKEAIEMDMLRWFIQQKELMPEDYKKHIRLIGRDLSREDFLRHVSSESQYYPAYNINQIREFERRVARKAKVYSYNPSNPNKIIIYGMSHSAFGEEFGAYEHRFVRGIAVELQERGGKIYFHGYPVPEEEILRKYKRRK